MTGIFTESYSGGRTPDAIDAAGFGAIVGLSATSPPFWKRYIIISGHNTDFPSMADALLDKFGNDYPIPRKVMPKWLVWLVAPMANKAMTRKWISRNVNLPWIGDNSKGVRELEMRYRPMKESMIDFFQQMIDSDQLQPPK